MTSPSVEFPTRHDVDVNVTLKPNAARAAGPSPFFRKRSRPMTTASADQDDAAIPPSRYRSAFAPGLFDGRRVWVTGGGSGIGRAVAHELASLGADVVISGRCVVKLDRVAAEVAEDGGRCAWRAFDIRDEEAVKAYVADVVASECIVHGLV